MKIKEQILKYKPLDWKWLFVILYMKNQVAKFFVYGVMLFVGISLYPNEIPEEVFINQSQKMTESLINPIKTMIEAGWKLGKYYYPNNQNAALLMAGLLQGILIALSIVMFLIMAHSILYWIAKRFDK